MPVGVLSQSDINAQLLQLPLWQQKGVVIEREFVAEHFAAAVAYINAVAVLAEQANHHPDILLYSWNRVRITLCTHDKQGLTERDFSLARQIDKLL